MAAQCTEVNENVSPNVPTDTSNPPQETVEENKENIAASNTSSGNSQGDDEITTISLRVRIEKRPSTDNQTAPEYETYTVDKLEIRGVPSLQGVRNALLSCELGHDDRDIFFPNWTRTLYASWYEGEQDGEPHYGERFTIESDEHLVQILEKEKSNRGNLCLFLQECRNVRYSRKKERLDESRLQQHAKSRAEKFARQKRCMPYSPHNVPPYFVPQHNFAFTVYQPNSQQQSTASEEGDSKQVGPVYFDQPLQFAYPIPPHMFRQGHSTQPAGSHYQEYSMIPPYMPMVPFMYSQPTYNRK